MNNIKKIFLLLAFNFILLTLFAQTPQSFKYQSVVRDVNGNAMQNQAIDFRISILRTSSSGTPIYIETFSATTNNFGLVNLEIGTGTVLSGIFASIDWSTDKYFLQVELDPDGNGYQLMGVSQLLSVPYALNAAKADNVNNNDTSATNEIQLLSQIGTTVNLSNGGGTISVADNDDNATNELQTISKTGSTVTLSNGGGSFTDEVNDADSNPTNEIQAISFSGDTLYLSNGNNVYLGTYTNLWQQNGNDIYYNNGYVGVGLTDPHGKLIVQGDASIPADSAIFEVRNKNGQVVFAVYQEGVRIYVDDTGTKAISSKGGFAVGGFNATKSLTNEYMRVTPDSVRVYIEEGNGSKSISTKGGFAVGGFNATKTTPTDYFNISASDSAGTIPMPGEARVMWYPLKEAFLAGRVVIENADSVGLNSFATGFQSKALGDYSQAFGYKARAKGNNATAIGNNTNATGDNSYAFGDSANVSGIGSYAIGTETVASGDYSFAIGSPGINYSNTAIPSAKATGDYSYAFGMGSVANNKGSFAIGTQDTASGWYALAMGYKTKAIADISLAMGNETKASGIASVAMGLYSEARGAASTALGRYSLASGSYSIAGGNYATASGTNSISFGEYSNSSSLNTIAIGSHTIASLDGALAIGYYTTASNYNSVAIGNGTKSSGYNSTAMGINTNAIGNYSTAMGFGTKTTGSSSTAMGRETIANGDYSTAISYNTIANGEYSVSQGFFTKANSYAEVVIGRYNDTTISINQTSWVSTDPIFIIGDGSSSAARHNAVTVLKNGNVSIGDLSPSYKLQVDGAVMLADRSSFPSSFAGHSGIFSYNGELYAIDAAGNLTNISPHEFSLIEKSEPMAWAFYSENKNLKQKINVDMLKMIRTIEQMSGEKLVNITDLNNKIIEDNTKKQISVYEEINNLKEQDKNLTEKIKEIDNLKAEIEQLKQLLEIKTKK